MIKLNQIKSKTIIRGLLLGFISFLGALLFTAFFIIKITYAKYQTFLSASQLSNDQLISLIKRVDRNPSTKPTTFLILGIDETENRPDFPQLTDTMMLLKVDPQIAKITALSLPRDLWSEEYQTKINALYEYGRQRDPNDPTSFPKTIIEDLTQQEIGHTLTISLDQLGKIIDMLGYISIEVKDGFVDERFPRSDVDITTERDPEKLYETVVFEPGLQQMDSTLALKYIRSRNSSNLDNGTDQARNLRQQQVISAIINKLSNPQLYWHNPHIAGELLSFYQDEFDQYLPLEQAISLAISIVRAGSALSINSVSLPISTLNEVGVIEHPNNLRPYQNQWVYIIKDREIFIEFIDQAMTEDKN
ncbi:MAG: Transcription attenuator LytR [Microgenomates bacterium 39_7]|nr:MAG: Transcription attenuator LytR [Microgenomates bacterium 39_7]